MSLVHADLAELHYEWNQLAVARSHAQEAIELGQIGNAPAGRELGLVHLARILTAEGEWSAAESALNEARHLVQRHGLPLWYSGWEAFARVRLLLAQGRVQDAVSWVEWRGLCAEDETDTLLETELIVLARVLVAQGEGTRALALLERLHRAAEDAGRLNAVVEILTVKACAYEAMGQQASAHRVLQRLLALAQPREHVRTLVDEGPVMRALLARYRHTPECRAANQEPYVDRLLAAFGEMPTQNHAVGDAACTHGSMPAVAPAWSGYKGNAQLVEPLTEREMEVLHLLATGMSDRQISEQMVVVVGTVKRHLNNLYGKLGVHSRTQALVRARELELLKN